MSRGWNPWDDWPAPSKPRPVEGGLKAKAQRGAIGATWWSKRFIAVLESFHMGARLDRGRRYARSGQVMNLSVAPGMVTASVQGSRAKPYRVLIALECLTEPEWDSVEEVLAGRAVFLARLLAGEMPEQIEEAFAACSLSVFPRSRTDLDTACSCPDSANPCKHVAATYYLLAEAFDADPFLMLAWRGRAREELLAGLRARWAGPISSGAGAGPAGGPGLARGPWAEIDAAASSIRPASGAAVPGSGAGAPAGEVLGRWWSAGPELATVQVRPCAAAVPDAVLRQLDPTVLELRGSAVADLLRPAYPLLTVAAASVMTGGTT